MKTKYIRTENNQIIIFPEYHQHSDFKSFKPISAGFLHTFVDEHGNASCKCYGESVSLNLKSDEVKDTMYAKRQIFGFY